MHNVLSINVSEHVILISQGKENEADQMTMSFYIYNIRPQYRVFNISEVTKRNTKVPNTYVNKDKGKNIKTLKTLLKNSISVHSTNHVVFVLSEQYSQMLDLQ